MSRTSRRPRTGPLRASRRHVLAEWSGTLGAAGARVLDRLLPPACAVCRATVPAGPPLCGVCESLLPEVPRPRCGRCGAPSTSPLDAERCAICDGWPEPLRAAASAFLHAPPADALVTGLKYRGWTALAPRMAGHMVDPARRLARAAGVSPVLLAVPLDPRGARRRGFNQAALLADGLAEATGWPRHTGGLARRSTRRRQAELGRAERMANVRAACYWEPRVPVPAEPMLLVDDVLTTGATAAAGAAAIEAAGGRCIGLVTFARSLPRPDAG